MNVKYKLNLDVYKDRNYESIVVAQNDDKSRIIECKLYADSQPVALSSSVTAAFNATVDNVIVAENVTCIVADNAVKITLAKSMLQLAGMMQCELVLSENDTILTTQHFSVYVNKSVINSKSKYEPNGGTLATKDDINAAIKKVKDEVLTKADKADTLAGYGITNAYNKSEIESKLVAKINNTASSVHYSNLADDVFTSKIAGGQLGAARATDVYTELTKKADKLETYSKDETDNKLNGINADVNGLKSDLVDHRERLLDIGLVLENQYKQQEVLDLDKWEVGYGSGSIENDCFVVTGSSYGSSPSKDSDITNDTYLKKDHVYYFCVNSKTEANNIRVTVRLDKTMQKQSVANKEIKDFEKTSFVFTSTSDGKSSIRFESKYGSASESDGKKTYIKEIMLIDLTEAFGQGKEPTAEYMDNLIDSVIGYIPDFQNTIDFREQYYKVLELEELRKSSEYLVYNYLSDYNRDFDFPFTGNVPQAYGNIVHDNVKPNDVLYLHCGCRIQNNVDVNITFSCGIGNNITKNMVVHPNATEIVYVSAIGYVPENGKAEWFVRGDYDNPSEEKDLSPSNFGRLVCLNLTEIFGQGKEPTVDDMDVIMNQFEDKFFKNYANINGYGMTLKCDRSIKGLNGAFVETNKDGSVTISSIPNHNWEGWKEIGTYGQSKVGSIPVYNKVHGTLETDGMFSALPIWGCWSENASGSNQYKGGHVFHGWTTDRKHRITMVQNIYRDDEAALFNYIPGDKSNTGEGVFIRLRLGADNVGKGFLLDNIYDESNHYQYTRATVFGRLNIQNSQCSWDKKGDGSIGGLPINTIPASSTANGLKGDFTFDKNYAYFCVADNTWKRIPLEAW